VDLSIFVETDVWMRMGTMLMMLLRSRRFSRMMFQYVSIGSKHQAICRVYADVGITGGHKLLEDFRHFFTRQTFGDEEKDGNTEVCFSCFYFLKSQWTVSQGYALIICISI